MSSTVSRLLLVGTLVIALMFPFVFSRNYSPHLYLNGKIINGVAVTQKNGEYLAPLETVVPLLGGSIAAQAGNIVAIKWGRDSTYYLQDVSHIRDNKKYVSLTKLAGRLGLKYRTTSSSVYVNTEKALLTSTSLESDAVSLFFDRRVPFRVVKRSSKTVTIRLFNVESISQPFSDLSSTFLRNIRLLPVDSTDNGILCRLTLRDQSRVQVRSKWGKKGYRIRISNTEQAHRSSDYISESVARRRAIQSVKYRTITRFYQEQLHTIHYLELSDWREHFKLEVALPGGIGSQSSLKTIVQRSEAIAGINGGFFNPATGLPIGLLISDGELLSHSWGERSAIFTAGNGGVRFLRSKVQVWLRGKSFTMGIRGINRPLKEDDLVLYTDEYTGNIDAVNDQPETVLIIKNGSVAKKFETIGAFLQSSDYLVAGTGRYAHRLSSFSAGDTLSVDWQVSPPVGGLGEALAAGPLLIKNEQVALNLTAENFDLSSSLVQSRAQRSVIATTRGGSLLLILIENQGVSLRTLPGLLLSAGLNIDSAMALDGGGSSSLVYYQGNHFRLVGSSRKIASALVFVPRYK